MVIILCFGTNCQAIWEKNYYPSIEECIIQSKPVKTYMMNAYPQSAGEIYCMTERIFEDYVRFLEEGGKPSITTPNAS
jgi:hypothetical protein